MPRITYTREDGFLEVRDIPNGLTQNLDQGILIGPPELTSLPLSKKLCKALNNRLVEAGFIQWPDFSGKRGKLTEIITSVVPDKGKHSDLKYKILLLYQQSYYAE